MVVLDLRSKGCCETEKTHCVKVLYFLFSTDSTQEDRKSLRHDFASKGYPFKNIFDFTTAGDWDCVAAIERLPALHYSVDFIFLSFGIKGFIVEL